jgi:RHS repeat-associated protein
LAKTYIYANGEILAQHDGDYTADRYFYLHDRLGSVRQVISYMTNGLVLNSYTYGPFGEMIAAESAETIENPFKFTGQWFDPETGEYYLRARQYDPQLMRMTSRDTDNGRLDEPITLHAYLYCRNDPLNLVDPNGKFGEGLFGVVVGAVIYEIGGEDAYNSTVIKVGGAAMAALSLAVEIYCFPNDVEEFRDSKFYKAWVKFYSAADQIWNMFNGD